MPRNKKDDINLDKVSIEDLSEEIVNLKEPIAIQLRMPEISSRLQWLFKYKIDKEGISKTIEHNYENGVDTYCINLQWNSENRPWMDAIVAMVRLCYMAGLNTEKEVKAFERRISTFMDKKRTSNYWGFVCANTRDYNSIQIRSISSYNNLYVSMSKKALDLCHIVKNIAEWLNAIMDDSYIQLQDKQSTELPLRNNNSTEAQQWRLKHAIEYDKEFSDLKVRELRAVEKLLKKENINGREYQAVKTELDNIHNMIREDWGKNKTSYTKSISQDIKDNEEEENIKESIKVLCELVEEGVMKEETYKSIKKKLEADLEKKRKSQSESIPRQINNNLMVNTDELADFLMDLMYEEEQLTIDEYKKMGYEKLSGLLPGFNKDVGVFRDEDILLGKHHMLVTEKTDITPAEVEKLNQKSADIKYIFGIAFPINQETKNSLEERYPELKTEIEEALKEKELSYVVTGAKYMGKYG